MKQQIPDPTKLMEITKTIKGCPETKESIYSIIHLFSILGGIGIVIKLDEQLLVEGTLSQYTQKYIKNAFYSILKENEDIPEPIDENPFCFIPNKPILKELETILDKNEISKIENLISIIDNIKTKIKEDQNILINNEMSTETQDLIIREINNIMWELSLK